jgi:thiaminase
MKFGGTRWAGLTSWLGSLNIFQLLLVHAEIVSELVDDVNTPTRPYTSWITGYSSPIW